MIWDIYYIFAEWVALCNYETYSKLHKCVFKLVNKYTINLKVASINLKWVGSLVLRHPWYISCLPICFHTLKMLGWISHKTIYSLRLCWFIPTTLTKIMVLKLLEWKFRAKVASKKNTNYLLYVCASSFSNIHVFVISFFALFTYANPTKNIHYTWMNIK